MKSASTEMLEYMIEHRRVHLMRDSDDWVKIVEALIDTYAVIKAYPPPDALNYLRCITEAVYQMGYERAKAEKEMPVFVVTEDKA